MENPYNRYGQGMKITRQLLIFDLDGVLIDETKKMHYDTLIESIKHYNKDFVVTLEAEAIMNTSKTSKIKIAELIKAGSSIDPDTIFSIVNHKQRLTNHQIDKLDTNEKLISLLSKIHEHSPMAVASNSHSFTVDRILQQTRLDQFISFSIGNDLVRNTKPHPEIFWDCMSHFGYLPEETVIFEDSEQGQQAAIASGARLEKILDNNHLLEVLEKKYVY